MTQMNDLPFFETDEKLDNLFIKINNNLLSPDNAHGLHLSVDAMYVYVGLQFMTPHFRTIRTNLEAISGQLPCMLAKSKPTNYTKLKEALEELLYKKLIKFKGKENNYLDEIDNKTPIVLQLAQFHNKSGFTMLTPPEYYDAQLKPIHFYIYLAVKRFEKTEYGGALYPFTQWAKILNKAKSTVMIELDTLVENGIIFKKSGKRLANKQQEVNLYSIRPITINTSKEFQNQDYKGEKIVKLYDKMQERQFDVFDLEALLAKCKEFKFLEADDFYMYESLKQNKRNLTPYEKYVYQAVDNRVKLIINNDNSKRATEYDRGLAILMAEHGKDYIFTDDYDKFTAKNNKNENSSIDNDRNALCTDDLMDLSNLVRVNKQNEKSISGVAATTDDTDLSLKDLVADIKAVGATYDREHLVQLFDEFEKAKRVEQINDELLKVYLTIDNKNLNKERLYLHEKEFHERISKALNNFAKKELEVLYDKIHQAKKYI